jgi:molybdate transport system substrate-binding protein
MRRLRLAALLALALPHSAGGEDSLRVLAAASLTEAFGAIAEAFEKAHPGSSVEVSFAGSQILRVQIEQGAPADVFASADLAHAQTSKSSGLLNDYAVFARNALVVVTPADGAAVRRVQDLARPGMKVVVAGPLVPVGRYTSQVLAKLSASGLYGDDFQRHVQANIVSQETSVRAVLSKVALGEADAGIVYLTDAAAAGDKVRRLAIDDRYNVVAEYPIGVVSRSRAPARAQAFVDFVSGPAGQALLRKHGFR